MLMLMLDVIQHIHAEVFWHLPKPLETLGSLVQPALGWAAWDARAALQRRQQQVTSCWSSCSMLGI